MNILLVISKHFSIQNPTVFASSCSTQMVEIFRYSEIDSEIYLKKEKITTMGS